jgi:hypothetical protein
VLKKEIQLYFFDIVEFISAETFILTEIISVHGVLIFLLFYSLHFFSHKHFVWQTEIKFLSGIY